MHPVYVKYLPVEVKFHPHIAPHLFALLGEVAGSLRIACYMIDDYFATALVQLLQRGVKVEVVIDKLKLVSPSCKKEQETVIALSEWGAQFRQRQPSPGLTSAQHEKSWLFDDSMLAVGSMNLTYNSVKKWYASPERWEL